MYRSLAHYEMYEYEDDRSLALVVGDTIVWSMSQFLYRFSRSFPSAIESLGKCEGGAAAVTSWRANDRLNLVLFHAVCDGEREKERARRGSERQRKREKYGRRFGEKFRGTTWFFPTTRHTTAAVPSVSR